MRTLAILSLSLMLAACETVQTTQPGAVGIERQQTMMVSDQEIKQAAAQEYRKVIAEAQAKGTARPQRSARAARAQHSRAHDPADHDVPAGCGEMGVGNPRDRGQRS